jgi:hypothetical protein
LANDRKRYADYLKDGVPICEIEKRGMTQEEAEAFKEEVEVRFIAYILSV